MIDRVSCPFCEAAMLRQVWAACRKWRARRRRELALWQWRRRAAFMAARRPESDEEFCAECLPGAPPRERDWVLGARRAIARFGRVPAAYICASEAFLALESLPHWCERVEHSFDLIRFIDLLEEEIGIQFTDQELEKLPSVEVNNQLTVRAFVRCVVELCREKAGD
jgi:hypothetical protein